MIQNQIDLLVSYFIKLFRLNNILKTLRKLAINSFYKLKNIIKKLYVIFKLHCINLWIFFKNKLRKKRGKYEQSNNEFRKLVKQNGHKKIEDLKVATIAIWEDIKNIVQDQFKKRTK